MNSPGQVSLRNREVMFANKKLFVFLPLILLAIVFLLLQSFAFNPGGAGNASLRNKVWPSQRDLRNKIWQLRKILWVYGTRGPALADAYRRLAQKRAQRSRWIKPVVVADSAVTEEQLATLPVALIGTPASNSILARVQADLPFKFGPAGFSIEPLFTSTAGDVFTLSQYPNPLQPTLPLSVISGNRDEDVLRFLEGSNAFSRRAGEFQVFRDGMGIVLGFFKQESSGAPWTLDLQRSRNYLAAMKTPLETEHYLFHYHGTEPVQQRIATLARQQEKRLARLLAELPLPPGEQMPKIAYHLYESAEDKGLMTGNTDLSHFNLRTWEVHTIFNRDLQGADFYADAGLLIAKYLGRSNSLALRDGLAIHFSEGWRQDGYQAWAKFFRDTGNANPLSEILDNRTYQKESYLFMRPLAGTLVDFLIEKYGWSDFIGFYRNWPAPDTPLAQIRRLTPDKLEPGWRAYLSRLPAARPVRKAKGLARRTQFQKGFSYAHEGYQIYNGYLSRKSAESLARLRALGTEWISLSPFGYLPDAKQPAYLSYSFGPGSENDESLIFAALQARKLGMGVMLKPHILMSGGHWGWPGDVEMKSEADWQAFFRCYTSWIRHYALLAKMYDMDIFCAGVELMQTTKNHQAEWRKVFAEIRKLYDGPLVYAANWWQEFDQIEFWDDLDYIGLNFYFPLSKKDSVTLDDLQQGIRQFLPAVEAVARKYNRPVLLTEIGFTSSRQPWKNPHERRRGAPPYFADQALCYQAVFETLWDKEWLAGFYWWKWPTYLEYGGQEHSGFTPNGKPAENVVREWYRRDRTVGRSRGN